MVVVATLPTPQLPGLELQLRDKAVDPVIVGGDPDVDTRAVPTGTSLSPADDSSLQPGLAHFADQGAPRVALRECQC